MATQLPRGTVDRPTRKKIGAAIKRARRARGMSLKEFGARFGVSSSIANNYERGESLPYGERRSALISTTPELTEAFRGVPDIDPALNTGEWVGRNGEAVNRKWIYRSEPTGETEWRDRVTDLAKEFGKARHEYRLALAAHQAAEAKLEKLGTQIEELRAAMLLEIGKPGTDEPYTGNGKANGHAEEYDAEIPIT